MRIHLESLFMEFTLTCELTRALEVGSLFIFPIPMTIVQIDKDD